MKYCPTCGNAVDDAVKFCFRCGHAFSVLPVYMADTPAGTPDADPVTPAEPFVQNGDAAEPMPEAEAPFAAEAPEQEPAPEACISEAPTPFVMEAPAPLAAEAPTPFVMEAPAPFAAEAPTPFVVEAPAPAVSEPRTHAVPQPVDKRPQGLLTTIQYILLLLLFSIPVIGLVFLFVFGCGNPKNASLKRFSLAVLILVLIVWILLIAGALVCYVLYADSLPAFVASAKQWIAALDLSFLGL